MRCPSCHTQNPDQAKFCLNCGARLSPLCPHCQATLPPQARFCTECGSPLAAPSAHLPTYLVERWQRLVPREYSERLLATRGQAVSERRLVTILFCDIQGSTALAEALDPEDVMEIMNGAFDILTETVARHEGTLARLMGDAILAFFGAPLSHEDDPQRAVRAALEIVAGARQYAERLESERGITGFNVRVGINTGLVVVGEVGSDLRVEYTAMGDPINLAARLEQHAPPGGILISHDTYRHVQGLFDFVPQEPLAVKGRAQQVQTYLVQRAKAREFRDRTRGVEGIETSLVGRQAEMGRLQDAFHAVVDDGSCQLLILVGDAGVGKSRLLYEFDRWAQAQPHALSTFKGRVSQEMQNLPYALLRDLFSARFQIRESDPADLARHKLVHGLSQPFQPAAPDAESRTANPDSRLPLPESRLPGSPIPKPDSPPPIPESRIPNPDLEMKAHLVGQLLGFDFRASPHVQAIGHDAQQLRDRALIYLGEYFRALAAQQPVLILLEDLHWADGSSLDATDRLAASLSLGTAGPSPVLFLCAARPSLYRRRPAWGQDRPFHRRLDLSPLSEQESHRLVEEILQHMEQVPDTLRDLLVTGAEGNPFFLEELIKMLIEEGVIHKAEDAWSVDAERLSDLQVPPTLTGVLQARLDRLPFDQRLVLQQASVVGRLFWDQAVAHLAVEAQTEPDFDQVRAALAAVGGREMVFPQTTSSFQGAHEYLFKHALLREVTYEGVLKRVRRVYHGLVAGWLMEHAGDRAGEYTGLIADHLALAGRTEEAVAYLRRAAEQAAAQYANEEAARHYSRALDLTPAEATAERYALLLAREALYDRLGRRQAQAQDLAALEALAATMDTAQPPQAKVRQVDVALRRSSYERLTGNLGAALSAAQTAADLARAARDLRREAEAHWAWGTALLAQRDYEAAQQRLERALILARESGARRAEADSLSELAWVHWLRGLESAQIERALLEQALQLYRQIGNRRGEASVLWRLGQPGPTGDLGQSRAYCEQARAIHCEIGNRSGEVPPLHLLAWICWGEDDYAGAMACMEQALAICREVGLRSWEGQVRGRMADTLAAQGHYAQAQTIKRQAVRIFRETGERGPEGGSLSGLGLIRYYQGDYVGARALLEKAGPLSREFAARWAEGKRLALLSLVLHALGDHRAARDVALQALENGPQTYHLGQGDSALALGHALAGLGDRVAATAAYKQALERYRQAGFLNPPAEALAGLARLELAGGELAQALAHVEEILDHLQAHTVDGTYEPFRIYLTCVRVLQARGDPRAGEILRTAYTLLQERAAGIEDERLRHSLLENVPAHRQLIQEAERAGLTG